MGGKVMRSQVSLDLNDPADPFDAVQSTNEVLA
jgi:hypothetical protein